MPWGMRLPAPVLVVSAAVALLAAPSSAQAGVLDVDPVCDGDAKVTGVLSDPLALLRSPGATIARAVSGAFTVTLPAAAQEGTPVSVSAVRLLDGVLTQPETVTLSPLPCPPSGEVNVRRTQSLASFVKRGMKVAVVPTEAAEVVASVRLGGLRGTVLAAGRTTASGPGRVALRLVPTPAGVRRLRSEERANVVLLTGLVDAQGHTGRPAPVRVALR